MKAVAMITLVLLAQLGFSQFPPDDNKAFINPEILPEYVDGGERGMLKLLTDSIRMPEIDKSGTVYITFTVGVDGIAHDFKLLKGLHPLADAEALRVMKMLKKFKPAMRDGKPVEIQLNIPVKFVAKE